MTRRPIQPDILAIWAVLFVAAVMFWASVIAAFAQDRHAWNHETFIAIQPTDQPGAVAEVVFANTGIHPLGREEFDLTLGDVTVTVVYEMNVSGADDKYTVIPPAGFIAYPESLIVPEDGTGVIYVMEEGLS